MNKEWFEDFLYDIKKKWRSFTYDLYRQRWYKFKLLWRLSKIQYWGSWEMVEPMMDYPFILFCEFYESIDWNVRGIIDTSEYEEGDDKEFTEHQNERYRELERLYKWYTIEKKQREEELEYLLHIWHEHHISWWGRCEDEPLNEKGCVQCYSAPNNRYADYLFSMLREEENKWEQEKEDALMRLMKMRNFLWH
jgi:hypothetical protein